MRWQIQIKTNTEYSGDSIGEMTQPGRLFPGGWPGKKEQEQNAGALARADQDAAENTQRFATVSNVYTQPLALTPCLGGIC